MVDGRAWATRFGRWTRGAEAARAPRGRSELPLSGAVQASERDPGGVVPAGRRSRHTGSGMPVRSGPMGEGHGYSRAARGARLGGSSNESPSCPYGSPVDRTSGAASAAAGGCRSLPAESVGGAEAGLPACGSASGVGQVLSPPRPVKRFGERGASATNFGLVPVRACSLAQGRNSPSDGLTIFRAGFVGVDTAELAL